MHGTALPDIPDAILDQAVEWLVKLRSGIPPAEGQTPLETRIAGWRAAHPLHELAWQELQASEAAFQRLGPLPLSPKQVIGALDTVHDGRRQQERRRRTLQLLGLGALGIGVGALTAGSTRTFDTLAQLGADYTTGTGERRTITLADGTIVKLNTNTALDVHYDASQRLLALRRGEIFINTGKDATRPFWIQTGHARLQALGTQFLVRQTGDATQLAVTEGRVAIYTEEHLQAVASPGDIFTVDAVHGAIKQVASEADMDPAGWVDNALVVKRMPLGRFINELARYRRGWLRCDPAVADLLVSGVFQIDNTDLALESLARSLPIRVEKRTRYWITLTARPGGRD